MGIGLMPKVFIVVSFVVVMLAIGCVVDAVRAKVKHLWFWGPPWWLFLLRCKRYGFISWVQWRIAWLLPREIAMLVFIRVYAHARIDVGPEWHYVCDAWKDQNHEARTTAGRERRGSVESTPTQGASPQQPTAGGLEQLLRCESPGGGSAAGAARVTGCDVGGMAVGSLAPDLGACDPLKILP